MAKKKLNRLDFMFDGKEDERLVKKPGQINGLDFVVSNLIGCTVYICDHTSQIFVDDCKNCIIHIGPVAGSLFVRGCENITLHAASSQLRISDSTNILCCVYVKTDPALERATNIIMGPYCFAYPLQDEHFNQAGLNPEVNKFRDVYDFGESSSRNMSPEEFRRLATESQTISFDDIEGDPVNPVRLDEEYAFDEEQVQQQEQVQEQEQEPPQKIVETQQLSNVPEEDIFGGGYSTLPGLGTQAPQLNLYPPQSPTLFISPEEQERENKLRELENDRLRRLQDKMSEEINVKNERKLKARSELEAWQKTFNSQKEARKKKNLEEESVLLQKSEQPTNPWEVIANNISIKDGDYSGSRDVTRFRQSLLAKRSDTKK